MSPVLVEGFGAFCFFKPLCIKLIEVIKIIETSQTKFNNSLYLAATKAII
jgi:hypothetical protein